MPRRLFSRGVIFTRARVSLPLLSLRKNGGLLVVYEQGVVLNWKPLKLCEGLHGVEQATFVVSKKNLYP